MLTPSITDLNAWIEQAKILSKQGHLPRYIPKLAAVNPEAFALCLLSQNNPIQTRGNETQCFPLMSIIKPFLLLYVLVELGSNQVFNIVGMEPSEYPYNSLEQLNRDQGKPRNPMINSGAIALADQLPGKTAVARCEHLRIALNQWGNCQLSLDKTLQASVAASPNLQNQRITQALQQSGLIENPKIALETYNLICCLSGTIVDLARLGMMLVQPPQLTQTHYRTVNALMMTCGLYQASAQFTVKVGLPTKSGVSGAILSIIPRQGAIACYSPPLDPQGNSIGGLFLIKKMAQSLNLSIFT